MKLAVPTFSTKGEKVFSQPDQMYHGPDHENLCRGKVSMERRLLRTFLITDISTFSSLPYNENLWRGKASEENSAAGTASRSQTGMPEGLPPVHLVLLSLPFVFVFVSGSVFVFTFSGILLTHYHTMHSPILLLFSLSDHCLALLNSYLVP